MLRSAKASFKSLRARRISSTSPRVACCCDTLGAEEAQGAASTHASTKYLAAIRLVQYVIVGLAEIVCLLLRGDANSRSEADYRGYTFSGLAVCHDGRLVTFDGGISLSAVRTATAKNIVVL